jgi:hypothetical protein
MDKKSKKPVKRRKAIRKEMRVAARITPELWEAVSKRAYEENKSVSIILVESLIKYLDFKMPNPKA